MAEETGEMSCSTMLVSFDPACRQMLGGWAKLFSPDVGFLDRGSYTALKILRCSQGGVVGLQAMLQAAGKKSQTQCFHSHFMRKCLVPKVTTPREDPCPTLHFFGEFGASARACRAERSTCDVLWRRASTFVSLLTPCEAGVRGTGTWNLFWNLSFGILHFYFRNGQIL